MQSGDIPEVFVDNSVKRMMMGGSDSLYMKHKYPHRSRSESMHRPAVHQWYAAAAGEQQRDEEKAVDAANGII